MTNNETQQALFEIPTETSKSKPEPKKKPQYWVRIVWLNDLQTAWGYLTSHEYDGSYDASKSPKRKPRLYKNIKAAHRTAWAIKTDDNLVTVEVWKGRIE